MSKIKQKFKVGQKVRLVDNREKMGSTIAMGWNPDMAEEFGKVVTIKLIGYDRVRGLEYIRTKENYRSWDFRFLEPINEKKTSRVYSGDEFIEEDCILPCDYSLKKVIENDKAVICFVEEDRTRKIIKTVAVCQEGDNFDLETGVEICMYKTLRKIADSKLKKY